MIVTGSKKHLIYNCKTLNGLQPEHSYKTSMIPGFCYN